MSNPTHPDHPECTSPGVGRGRSPDGRRRYRCPDCGVSWTSSDRPVDPPRPVHCQTPCIRAGVRQGYQRWRCPDCGKFFTDRPKRKPLSNADRVRRYYQRKKAKAQ